MKQKIKVLFVFAAILCLSFIFATAANADTVITADVLPVTYDSLKVDIHCGASYLTSTQFYLQYDPQTLSFVSAETLSEKQGDFGTATLVEDGKVFVSFYAAKHAFNNGMLTLHFDLVDHKSSADYAFSASFENLYVSKDNSGADSAVADDGKLLWNIAEMTGLALSVKADSLVYEVGECVKPDYENCLSVYGVWPNETKIEIPYGVYTVNDAKFNGGVFGLYSIEISYRGKKAAYNVAVGLETPENLTITKKSGFKTEYKQDSDATLDVSNLTVMGYYPKQNPQYVEIKADEYTVTGFNTDAAPGKQTVTISYFGKSVTVDITIIPNNPDKIVIEKAPSSLTYKQNAADGLSLDGIVVKAHFANGEVRTLDVDDLATSGFNAAAEPGKQTITVTYRGKSATFDIMIESAVAKPTKIEVVSLPIKTVYEQNSKDSFVKTGLKVNAYYADGTEELVRENDLNIEGFNTKVPVGQQKITVKYLGCSATFEITIEAPDDPAIPKRIEFIKYPDKVEYELGTTEKLDLTGMQAKAIFVDADGKQREEDVAISDVVVVEFKPDALGWLPVYISYKGCITLLTVNVVEATVKYKLGDINEDGNVTTADARLALRNSVGLEKLSDVQLLAADINKNGKVETSDARLILRAAVGLEKIN